MPEYSCILINEVFDLETMWPILPCFTDGETEVQRGVQLDEGHTAI